MFRPCYMIELAAQQNGNVSIFELDIFAKSLYVGIKLRIEILLPLPSF